ncbi:MAG: carbon-nitrogen hydrolase family protein [Thermoplasmata archaeon]|nr:carbon-nitrogen hydrolase family protein [Thermoplasmata archaeon]
MRVALAQRAPAPGDVTTNLTSIRATVEATSADLVVFPELFVSGYRIGDRFHGISRGFVDLGTSPLGDAAGASGRSLVVGVPLPSADRPGEVLNAAVLVRPDRSSSVQVKRYLPTYGPFEEGAIFTPTDRSAPLALPSGPVGLQICYDVFFPEVSRELALAGATLLVAISASPVTSRPLFEKLLPARAVENALPVVYVNRVGVEDGIVFGGGSGAWDARGEPIRLHPVSVPGLGPEESVLEVDIDLSDAPRWRPFRPVLRDRATRPAHPDAHVARER